MEPPLPEDRPISLTVNVTLQSTEKIPDWFMLAYKVFAAGGLGSTYGDLLTASTSLKKRLGFQQVCISLQPKGHPELLGKWVNRG